MLYLYFDGLCEPVNPGGIATYGYVIKDEEALIREECGVVGAGYRGDDVSNNVAEYKGLIKGLKWILENGMREKELKIRGDSQLVVKQLKGEYRVKAPRIIPLYEEAIILLQEFESYSIEWVPREENEIADSLTRRALKEFVSSHEDEVSRAYGRSWAKRVISDPR